MKVEKRDSSKERSILTAMIVHDQVLSDIAPKWDKEGLFNSPWSNLIGGWCVKFLNKYGKAPGRSVEGLFQSWSSKASDKDLVRSIEKFLGQLSGSYSRRRKEINPKYVTDTAGNYFNEVRIGKLADVLRGDIESGELQEAYKRLSRWDQINVGSAATIDVLQDKQAWKRAFDQKSVPVIQYKGAIGQLFGNRLERDGFIGLMGKEKVGKSFWLQDMAWTAMRQRKKVLYFQIGDLSESQQMVRFGIRAAGIPLEAGKVRIPTKLIRNEKEIIVSHKTRKYKHGITMRQAYDACQKVMQQQVRSKNPFLKLIVRPMNSLGMGEIRSEIQRLERKDWIPDVVVIDYADLLAPPPGYTESRHEVNHNWKAMRQVSQEYHCLVLTATQVNAATYKMDAIDMSSFSEDKRKFAHVTGMLAINQIDEEQEDGIQRVGWVVLREGGFKRKKHVTVAGSLAIGNPCYFSIW